MCEERIPLSTVLDTIRALGYDGVDRTEGYPDEACGRVPLPEQHRQQPPKGLRRFLPRVYRDAGDPNLVPEDLRAAVEQHGWTVQAMGRNDRTVTVVISKNGV